MVTPNRLWFTIILLLTFLSVGAQDITSDSLIKRLFNTGWDVFITDPSLAIERCDSVFEIIGDDTLTEDGAGAFYLKGYAYSFGLEDVLRGNKNFFRSAQIYELVGDTCFYCNAYFNMATSSKERGQNLSALEYYYKSLKYPSCGKITNDDAIVYRNLGLIYLELGLEEEALIQFKKVFETDSVGPNIPVITATRIAMLGMEISNGNFKGVETKLKDLRNRKFQKDFVQQSVVFQANTLLARLYSKLENVDSLKKVIDYQKPDIAFNALPSNRVVYDLNLTNYYFMTNQLDSAESVLKRTKRLAKRYNLLQKRIMAIDASVKLHKLKGDFKKALKYKEKKEVLSDSLFSYQVQASLRTRQVENLATQLNNSRQREEYQALKLRNRNVAFIFLFCVLMIVLVFGFFLFKQKQFLDSANKRLKIFNKEKDNLIATLSHDIRSPLATVNGIIELIESESVDENEKKYFIENLKSSFNNLQGSLDTLLNWSMSQMRHTEVKKEEIQVAEVLVKVQAYLKPILSTKNITIKVPDLKDKTIYIDKGKLELILRNLMGNAVKYSYQDGEVSVEYSEDEFATTLIIKDQGVGMTDIEKQKIKDNRIAVKLGTDGEKGTGLGLQLVRKYVAKNHGVFTLESEEGKGTKAILWFPKKIDQ